MMESIEKILDRYRSLPQFESVQLKKADQLGMDEVSPLHMACYHGRLGEVEVMLNSEIDINVKGDIGSTPLHEAVLGGHYEIAKLLVVVGAIKELPNDYGETPLDLAMTSNDKILISLLSA